jgi:hypothetical protein
MRRGLLQDHANQVCQMFTGWRLTIVDLPLLVSAGRGTVDIDLLTGECRINGTAVDPLGILCELDAWLSDDLIRRLRVHADFEIEESRDGTAEQRRLRLDCMSELATAEHAFSGRHVKSEIWTHKGSDGPWMIHDEHEQLRCAQPRRFRVNVPHDLQRRGIRPAPPAPPGEPRDRVRQSRLFRAEASRTT